MEHVTVGVIGLGVMGDLHLKAIRKEERLRIVGLAEANSDLRAAREKEYGVAAFAGHEEMIRAVSPDYVVICTPHFSHTEIAVSAMAMGAHAFVEKPLAVTVASADACIAAAAAHKRLLGVNFLRRLQPVHLKARDLIRSGALGRITRVALVSTNWFRSMAYFRSGGWRATWPGEGGGILVNQAPHDLDLLLWWIGLPECVYAEIATLGHEIEVEDDVVALMRWPDGATGTLHVTTNEAPGRSAIEIAGTRGTLSIESGKLTLTELAQDAWDYGRTTTEKMAPPPVRSVTTTALPDTEDRVLLMHRNFAAALRGEAPLVCSGEDALREVELANALLLSGVVGRWVRTPVDRQEVEDVLARLIASRRLDAVKAQYRHSMR